LWVAPVDDRRVSARIEFWNSRPAGFDFGAARSIAVNTGYPAKLNPQQLLGSPHVLSSLDLLNAPSGAITAEATLGIARSGTLHGIGGWFTAVLAPGAVMTNSPLAETPIKRRQVCFPVGTPVKVAEGDRIRVAMQILPHESMVNWKVEVMNVDTSPCARASVTRFAHSTFQGMLISAEDLRRTRPGFRPRLSAAGEARRSVLDLCDGRRSLAEIEHEVHERHAGLFRDRAEAAAFVAEVVTRYSV